MADIQTSTWNETASNNNASPPDGAPENMARSAVNDVQREVMGAIKREWNRSHPTQTTTGTGGAYVLTYATAPPAYATGAIFCFKLHATNTLGPTLNINSLGARNIRMLDGNLLPAAGELIAGATVTVAFDGTQFIVLSVSSYGPGWQRVDQQVLGSGTNYTSPVLPTAFSAFRLEWQDARGNLEVAPFARFSTDGGSTYKSGGSDYTVQGFAFVGAAAASVLNAAQSFITLGQNVSASAACSGSIEFSRTSGIFRVESHGNFSGGLWRAAYGGTFGFTGVTNIQSSFASSTINTGTFTLLGRA